MDRFCGLFTRLQSSHHRHPRQSAHKEGLAAFLFRRKESFPPSLHTHLTDMTFPSSQRILFSIGVPLEWCILLAMPLTTPRGHGMPEEGRAARGQMSMKNLKLPTLGPAHDWVLMSSTFRLHCARHTQRYLSRVLFSLIN